MRMNLSATNLLLAAGLLLACGVGCALLKRARARTMVLPEELSLAAAWIFVVGSLIWLGVFLNHSTLLGFGAPWTWLAAAHFAFAGYGALTVTSLACRVVSSPLALRMLRSLLLAHPIAYLVTAAGISGYRYCDEAGATIYALLFLIQPAAVVLGQPNRMARAPRRLMVVALMVPVFTMAPALAWAWGFPIFDLADMVRYHGLANAVGHVGLGLAAFVWGRPPAHAPMQEIPRETPET